MTPAGRDAPHRPTPAERLFAAWLEALDRGEDRDLDSLAAGDPDLQGELAELFAQHARLARIREEAGLSGTLTERLRRRFGVELPGGPPAGEALAEEDSDVLARLSERGPASTRYRVRDEVARGGMGAVLRVWDEDLRRYLAMKVLRGDKAASGDPRLLARFLEEAQVTGQLDHPGIVPVHELGLDAEGRVFFTMKLVRGQTLKQVFEALARGEDGWTTARVLGLLLKVCEATSYAHDKGVIHRDLKPANVMVGRYGEVYVMDWGLARVLEREERRDLRVREDVPSQPSRVHTDRAARASQTPDSPLVTMDGDVIGTPAYMPPEQAHGRIEAMGPRSDVYAVGAMLYQLLAGHMPYVRPGDSASNYAVWRWVREGPPTPLEREAPDAPPELVAICERAMQREPGERYPDMTALAADLQAFLEGHVVEAFESGALAQARKWVRRNRGLAAALAATMLAITLGGLGFAIKAREATRAAFAAESSATEAREQRDAALTERAKVLRLSDARLVRQLVAEADALWPAHPEKIPEFESWLARARAMHERLALHRETLARLERPARELQAEELAAALAAHPLAQERRMLEAEHRTLRFQLEHAVTDEQRAWIERRSARMAAELAILSEWIDGQSRRRFETNEEQWQHDLLVELIAQLEALGQGLLGEDVVAPPFGWSVPRRLAFARQLERDFAPGGRWAEAWRAALPQLRADHPELGLTVQVGLVPLSPSPDSGLWEFAHLATGEVPRRRADGTLDLDERSGVVLVLFDRDGFWMGAQREDPGGRNYDPQSVPDQGPVHEVELSPFFLAKHELTQGQWVRMTGSNPSLYRENWRAPDGSQVTWLHPVEQVSWVDVTTWLPRFGLRLPSEAQWEYGARGGTDTPWWTGAERETLADLRAANLADESAARGGASWTPVGQWPGFDDGYIVHAPVTAHAPNPFGLYGVVGNVFELCQDGYDGGYYSRSPRIDPLCSGDGRVARVARGGGYDYGPNIASAAARGYYPPTTFNGSIGVRAGRGLDP